ncbi:MAG: N-6 DNA methylase [Chloroflexi bacterium]|nr:N-6 DNA methylase [Chloroflexota bacterium]
MTTKAGHATSRRFATADHAKSEGITYTPRRLAEFVASKIADEWRSVPIGRAARILDPAAGDGELLIALAREISNRHPKLPIEIFGFETDTDALRIADVRLSEQFPATPRFLKSDDFLNTGLGTFGDDRQIALFTGQTSASYDLIIANPPYVRTQILGAEKAQFLGKRFGLSGRVDLYHAFMLAISRVLNQTGVSGMIVSNRFMTTRSGMAVRKALTHQMKLLSIWDFGDTRLFDAAVLPAVVIAGGIESKPTNELPSFVSIYETVLNHKTSVPHPVDAMSHQGIVQINDGRKFSVSHGYLPPPSKPGDIWRMANNASETWLATVVKHSWGTFKDIGKVRVGVKTCADKIFVRSDWDDMPAPPELLRQLTTHHSARSYKPVEILPKKSILYPHESVSEVRKPVDISSFPNSRTYLESHREVLEGRTYLTNSGRKWFEIWVPHDPLHWEKPKLIFRDIAQDPTFWIDLNGTVVHGDCYWLIADRESQTDLLWLAAAVGNSSFINKFYDFKFQNRLYAGRRRFMTQYVEQFPLPDPLDDLGIEIIATAKQIYNRTDKGEVETLKKSLNGMVWCAFGFGAEEINR